MTLPEQPNEQRDQRADSLLKRHPRLGILLVAFVFYFILCAMLMTVIVLVLRG